MPTILAVQDSRTQPSFSLSNRLARTAWGLVYALFFRTSPRPLHAWRAFLLKCFGAKLGKNVHVYSSAIIWAPWNLEMHDHACIGDDVTCYSMGKVVLGERCVVSQGVYLCTGTHDYTTPSFQLYAMPITVGADAWVCAQAFVGPGVTVGEGAVVGARSVVTKSLPEWMVCAGNPCKPLKPRVMKAEGES